MKEILAEIKVRRNEGKTKWLEETFKMNFFLKILVLILLKQQVFLIRMEQRALKNVISCLNTNIYSNLGTSGGQSSNLYLNVVHFLNAVLIRHLWQLKTKWLEETFKMIFFLKILVLILLKQPVFLIRMEQRALKNANTCFNTNIYSYLQTSGRQSSYLFLNVVHFFQHRC